MDQQSFNDGLLPFLQQSCTPFHAVSTMCRQLQDAGYHRLQEADAWPQEIISDIIALTGVKDIETDANSSRIVVTFDKSLTSAGDINVFFKAQGIKAVLLNEVSHVQRLHTIKKEARFGGLPQ